MQKEGNTLNFLKYNTFEEFCKKNQFTPEEGLKVLDREIERIKGESDDFE